MKVSESGYIKKNKPLFKKLVSKLYENYTYVSLLAQDNSGKSINVSKSGVIIDAGSRMLVARGFVVRVFKDGRFFEYSTNDISEEKIDFIIEEINKGFVFPSYKTEEYIYEAPNDDPIVFSKSTEYEIDPEELGDEQIVNRMKAVYEKGMAMDNRILNCQVRCNYQKYSKLFISGNKELEQNIMWTCGAVLAMTLKGEEVKMSYKPFSKLGGAEILNKYEEILEDAVHTAIELLDSVPLPPGEYECICTPETTGMIVHEAFGHGVEMDMFVKDRALAKKYVGEYVASPLITMHDGNAVDEVATYFFDDEGTLSHDTVVIDKGILVAGISDYQSAKTLGTSPTGNGRRESFERKAYTRMTNTYFEAGDSKVEEMIASIEDGLLLEDPTSGMEDPKNWGIQCMVNIAREIKDGKLTGKIYSPIILTGYVPDLLKSISMVSDTLSVCGSGYCGKGYKEWVKVSDGGPYIKAKIRLG